MLSFRAFAACVGASGRFSISRDFFGYSTRIPSWRRHSLLGQIRLLRGKHLHLDVIRVAGEQFELKQLETLDSAIAELRRIYEQVDLGVGRIGHYMIPEAESDGLEIIESRADSKALRRRWRGPNDDAIDVFVVHEFSLPSNPDAVGIARINTHDTGCPEFKDLFTEAGCIIGLSGGDGKPLPFVMLGMVLAHELGHHLGLVHVENFSNLMFRKPNGTGLAVAQGQLMRTHCSARGGC